MATKVVMFGNERLATGVTTSTPVLHALIAAGYEVAAIVTSNAAASSRRTRELEIQTAATEHHIPVWLPSRPSDISADLTALKADIAVLVAYGRIIPQAIIDIFPAGIINLHPSLLPLHRGPIPLESVILDGSGKTGLSIMQLTAAMDAGPVWAQHEIKLTGTETKQMLADRLLAAGAELITSQLPRILAGSSRPTPQTDANATYDQRIRKADGQLDFTKPALQLEREIRAYLGWPSSYTQLAGRDIIVTAAHPDATITLKPGQVAASNGQLAIGTTRNALVIDQLKPAGKREMTAAEFIAGVPQLR